MPPRRASAAACIAFRTLAVAGALAAAPAFAAPCCAPDWLTATAGYGEDVAVYGIGARWAPATRIEFLESRRLELLVDAQAGYWVGRGTPTPHRTLWDFSVTPMLRWRPSSPDMHAIYIEGGVGVRALTSTRINNDRQFGIALQFGEQIGIGAAFGPHDDYEIGVYVQHVSNAELKPDANWGLTYPGVVLRARLP